VVFEKELPTEYKGFKVINGDETDIRYMDAKGCIVGLVFKRVRNKIDLTENKFVIPKTDINCKFAA
jgi:hypothetical protein